MNVLPGRIEAMQFAVPFCSLQIRVAGYRWHSIVLETPETAPYLRFDAQIDLLFKETDVLLSRDQPTGFSAPNICQVEIQQINNGQLLSRVSLRLNDHSMLALVTSEAVQSLALRPGQTVFAWINSHALQLAPP